MHWRRASAMVALLGTIVAGSVAAQAENPDYRIRAKLRTPSDGGWGADESVGNVEFRVHSRFLQIYYGGVRRQDEYKFKISFDYTDISGFEENYPGSVYDTDYDAYINDGFVGRVFMNTETTGIGELVYDSRHPEPPDLPLPDGFPEIVDAGDVASVYPATGPVPAIGDAPPTGAPLFVHVFEEQFARGDVDQNGKVDEEDFPFLLNNFDPLDERGPHVGPAFGDFSGDNRSDMVDYDVFVANWTESQDPPPPPISPASVDEIESGDRLRVVLASPFVSGSQIRLYVPSPGAVTMEVFSIQGARLASRRLQAEAGWQSVAFDGRSDRGAALPSGTYLYRVRSATDSRSEKLVILR
ncbi:MAG: T9SS type A sorting domain-containing protein [Candidatus Eisenbacteria bacterium]|uniref:T9SS type A sorting domain-containing protein n=1 Tax=Eiseniibacteriota bacterium TaxID=2212470 RepID=A0A956LY38_UNCEI|nr:T9SS type A sorting domain-containing protein [Candidatus Eisenbacteria bacterium]